MITKERSYQKPGTIIEENNRGIKISTVDYYIWLYYDRLEELLDACQINHLSLVKDICSVKEHINQYETTYGWTPLMVATYHNNIEIAKYLLINGADINAVNYNGKNLLMYAKDTFMEKNDSTLFDLYLNLGIEPTRKDYSGHDLYFYTKDNEKLKRYLMKEDDKFQKKL